MAEETGANEDDDDEDDFVGDSWSLLLLLLWGIQVPDARTTKLETKFII